ncbi:unnamed protein product [Caenorhabditis angaria]|uniref:Uncharacterized protein n=1 Tax=Caenorhabditis angaria TaxID=860376 RepID=A0A9P1MWW3_9PELO|nr:unnamed protein product [Caenorhabditis angaria]
MFWNNWKTETKNTLRVSFSFLLLFFAVLSTESIFHPLVVSYADLGTHNIEKTDAFTSLAIVYFVSVISAFFVSPIVDLLSPKWAMVIGMTTNFLSQAQLLYVNKYLMYFTMLILGVGTNLCWIGQGQYITNNCTDKTREKNTSLQWGFYKISLILGGITFFIYFLNTEVQKEVQSGRINYFVGFMMTLTFLAILNTAFLPKSTKNVIGQNKKYKELLAEVFGQLKTKRTLLLTTIYMLLGVSRAFWVSIFPGVVKYSKLVGGNTSQMFALSMIATGVGQVFGAFLITGLGVRARKIGRNNIVVFAILAQILVMILIILSFPDNSVRGDSFETGLLFSPNIGITLFCSTLLGFADAVLHTQVYSYIADFYSEESSSAFSIFRCFCAITTVVLFIVAKYFNLLVISGLYLFMTLLAMISVFFIKPNPDSPLSLQA